MSLDLERSTPELFAAMSSFHGKIKLPRRDSRNPHFKSSYASMEEILDVALPILAECGLAVSQFVNPASSVPVGNSHEPAVEIITLLAHKDGGRLTHKGLFRGGPWKSPQGDGSLITYARRYSLKAVLCLADADDDGEEASGRPPARTERRETAPPSEEAVKIRELREKLGWDLEQLGKVASQAVGCSDLRSAPADKLKELIAHMEKVWESNRQCKLG